MPRVFVSEILHAKKKINKKATGVKKKKSTKVNIMYYEGSPGKLTKRGIAKYVLREAKTGQKTATVRLASN